MNELEWWQACLLIIAVGIAAGFCFVMKKIAVKLDFNATDWFSGRRETLKERLPIICPHVEFFEDHNGKLGVQGLFESPPGTVQAQCTQCGQILIGGIDQGQKLIQYYAARPQELLKRQKQFREAVRKVYDF